ncbi:MAG: YicC family protein [Deltaproteobacteria bacterium]|nr:YicC family protein [Deltaproteobacteria bacterium]
MIKSMTGYGRAESICDGRRFSVEIKSLNHRYLEMSVRLPGILSQIEVDIKKKLGEKLSRGKIEVTIRMDMENGERTGRYDLNLPLVKNYHALLLKLKQELNLADDVTLEIIAGLGGIFVPLDTGEDIAALWKQLEKALDEAMATLVEMKQREGEMLYRDLVSRIDLMKSCLDSIAQRAPQAVAGYQKRLAERVKEITGGMEIDAARLCQEVAIMAEKSDITEEIVRFKSHISQFNDMLGSDEAVGRKVDFLLQEMGREVNTIGSKSNDAEISKSVIEIKSELAKVREQVQNIE